LLPFFSWNSAFPPRRTPLHVLLRHQSFLSSKIEPFLRAERCPPPLLRQVGFHFFLASPFYERRFFLVAEWVIFFSEYSALPLSKPPPPFFYTPLPQNVFFLREQGGRCSCNVVTQPLIPSRRSLRFFSPKNPQDPSFSFHSWTQ